MTKIYYMILMSRDYVCRVVLGTRSGADANIGRIT